MVAVLVPGTSIAKSSSLSRPLFFGAPRMPDDPVVDLTGEGTERIKLSDEYLQENARLQAMRSDGLVYSSRVVVLVLV